MSFPSIPPRPSRGSAAPDRPSRVGYPFLAGVILAGGALLAACSSSAGSTTTSTSASGGSTTPTTLAKVPLVVYSAQGYDKAVTTAFQKATGITVQLDDDSTGPLLAKIQAEKNNPKWGLLWVDGATAFAQLDLQNLLYRGFEPQVNWTSVGKASVPANKSFVPTGITLMAGAVYDTKTVTSPPTSWQDLLGAKWRGAVGMNDPAVSGPTFPFIAGMMSYLGGVSQGESYFTKLKADGLHVFQTNGDTLNALETGQIKVALIQSSAGIGAQFTTKTIKLAYLSPITVLPSAIGIDIAAPPAERAEAEQFISYVLSAAGQRVMQSGDPQGDSLYWPVIQGVTPLAPLPPLSTIHTQTIDPYLWGAKEATINQWFVSNIVQ